MQAGCVYAPSHKLHLVMEELISSVKSRIAHMPTHFNTLFLHCPYMFKRLELKISNERRAINIGSQFHIAKLHIYLFHRAFETDSMLLMNCNPLDLPISFQAMLTINCIHSSRHNSQLLQVVASTIHICEAIMGMQAANSAKVVVTTGRLRLIQVACHKKLLVPLCGLSYKQITCAIQECPAQD
jgi:hypothetical protein